MIFITKPLEHDLILCLYVNSTRSVNVYYISKANMADLVLGAISFIWIEQANGQMAFNFLTYFTI